MEKTEDGENILATIKFTDDQSEEVSKWAGRKIHTAHIASMSPTKLRTMMPGMLMATEVVCCW